MKTELYNFRTPWGVDIKAYAREGTIDFNTHMACISEDEYRIARLPDNGVAIDLGSYIGGCSLALAAKGYKVYAFEPLNENYELGRMNARINNLDPKIKFYLNSVTSRLNEKVEIYYSDTETELGRLHEFIGTIVPRGTYDPSVKDGKCLLSRTTTLEEIFKQDKIKRCNFLKVDIEGAEWEIFENISPDVLDRIDRIAIEIDGSKENPASTIKFAKLLKDKFVDVSQEYFPEWSQPGPLVHGYYINKNL